MTDRRIFAGLVVLGFLAAVSVPAVAATDQAQDYFQRGERAYYREDYAQALEWYQRSAELDNLEAMKSLGLMYAIGHGVKKDRARAGDLYRKMLPLLRIAAQENDISAMRTLAYMCENGLGVPQRVSSAIGWYRRAAGLGDVTSMRDLAALYDLGLSMPRDQKESLHWLRQAADHGDTASMRKLAQHYEHGTGTDPNKTLAIQWYQSAASFGDNAAQNELRRLGAPRVEQLKLYSASGYRHTFFVRYQGIRIDLDCFKRKEHCLALQAVDRAHDGSIKLPRKKGSGPPYSTMCSRAGGRWAILRDAGRKEYFLCRFFDKTMVAAEDLYLVARAARH